MERRAGDSLFVQGLHQDAARAYARAGETSQLRKKLSCLSALELYEEAGEYAFYLDDACAVREIAHLNLHARNFEMARRLFEKTGDKEMLSVLERMA
jgi:hypothetical protein